MRIILQFSSYLLYSVCFPLSNTYERYLTSQRLRNEDFILRMNKTNLMERIWYDITSSSFFLHENVSPLHRCITQHPYIQSKKRKKKIQPTYNPGSYIQQIAVNSQPQNCVKKISSINVRVVSTTFFFHI